jgi:hypothetical protein
VSGSLLGQDKIVPVPKHHTIKMCEIIGIKFHTFLIFMLDAGECQLHMLQLPTHGLRGPGII